MGGVKKCQKSIFKVNFLCQKSLESLFFSLKNTILTTFLSLTFLITSFLKSRYYQNYAQFLTARHYTNSQNSLITFEYVDF